jgi:flagellar protein FlaJ
MVSITSFSYRYFNWAGAILSKTFYSEKHVNLAEELEDAGLKVYPEAYFSAVGLFLVLSIIAAVPIILLTGFILLSFVPFFVILLGYAIPKTMAYERASKLDIEVPFAGTYISVMATGGLSPYASLKKLKGCTLLPNISKAVKNIEVDVLVKGFDPVTAMEKSAQHLPSKDYKDLMLGYTSTLRSGGDVIHYLSIRTEKMFRDLGVKVRAFGERASMLMESYIAISILLTLSLTIIFMTSIAFESFWQGGFTVGNFLLYSFFVVPGISILFIYLADSSQIHEPVSEWGSYKVFLATSPLMIFLIFVMYLPFAAPESALPFSKPFVDFVTFCTQIANLERGYEASIGMAIALLVGTVPAAFANHYYSTRGKGIENDVTIFLRDFTETRKTGASPEKCIENLAKRNYGSFSKHLVVASRQIRWGLPFKVIYETFRKKIKSWMALINLYLLVDAIEVGGGAPETLETLTKFSEMLSSLEKEKKAMLRPLLIIPYIGCGIMLFSTIVFVGFMRFVLLSLAQQSLPFGQFVTIILPPLILQAYLTGLVTGKIGSGTLSNGFKHASILVILGLALIPLTGLITMPFQWG